MFRSAQSPTILRFGDFLAGRPIGEARSSQWGKYRDAWLDHHGWCAACGYQKDLNVHHIVPFHIDPERELDTANFITLGEKCPTGNHHLLFGHLGLWASWNTLVVQDAERIFQAIKQRPRKF